MDQQAIMKRRMISAIVICIISIIGMLVFIGLYVDETRRVQETYRSQYHTSLKHAGDDITSYLNAEGDMEMRYTRLVSDMSNAGSFAFLIDGFTEKQIVVNELYTVLLKYPDQMKGKLEDVSEAVKDMQQELDKGYDKAQEIIDSVDKKGN